MIGSIGRISGTEQDSATYDKKVTAKATVSEAQAIAELASAGPLMVARFAVLIAIVACVIAGIALLVTLKR